MAPMPCQLIGSISLHKRLEDDLVAIAPGGACDHNIERCFRAWDDRIDKDVRSSEKKQKNMEGNPLQPGRAKTFSPNNYAGKCSWLLVHIYWSYEHPNFPLVYLFKILGLPYYKLGKMLINYEMNMIGTSCSAPSSKLVGL